MSQPWAWRWARRPPEVPANLDQPVMGCAPFSVPFPDSCHRMGVPPLQQQHLLPGQTPRSHPAGPYSYSRMCSRCNIYKNIPFERFQGFFFSLQSTAFPCHIANWQPDDHRSLNSTQQNFSSIIMVDSADAYDLNTLCSLLASVQDNEHFRT